MITRATPGQAFGEIATGEGACSWDGETDNSPEQSRETKIEGGGPSVAVSGLS